MSEYTLEQKREARKILGILDQDGKVIKVKDLSREALIDTIFLSWDMNDDQIEKREASIKALEARLKSAHQAKALANRRADLAEKGLRQLIDTFSVGE